MQLFISILMICSASSYLVLKWLPKKHKRNLYTWLIKKTPQLSAMLNIPERECSDGCSSCGTCEQVAIKNSADLQIKIIQIFPNSSTLN